MSTIEEREDGPNPFIALACCTGAQQGIVNSAAAAWIYDRLTGSKVHKIWTQFIQSEDW